MHVVSNDPRICADPFNMNKMSCIVIFVQQNNTVVVNMLEMDDSALVTPDSNANQTSEAL